jgi:hypothetical protein
MPIFIREALELTLVLGLHKIVAVYWERRGHRETTPHCPGRLKDKSGQDLGHC